MTRTNREAYTIFFRASDSSWIPQVSFSSFSLNPRHTPDAPQTHPRCTPDTPQMHPKHTSDAPQTRPGCIQNTPDGHHPHCEAGHGGEEGRHLRGESTGPLRNAMETTLPLRGKHGSRPEFLIPFSALRALEQELAVEARNFQRAERLTRDVMATTRKQRTRRVRRNLTNPDGRAIKPHHTSAVRWTLTNPLHDGRRKPADGQPITFKVSQSAPKVSQSVPTRSKHR